jgi:hypothetical protein
MKIENKISNILEIALLAISVVVAVMFFVGGYFPDTDEPVYTNLLLNTTFVLAAIAILVTFILSLANFVKNFLAEPKNSVKSLLGPLGIIAIVYISSIFADGTPMTLPGYDGNSNQGVWLIAADVCLFTTYAMTVLTVLAWAVTATVKALR